MDVTDILEGADYEVVGPAPTVEAALAVLDGYRPDACLLDVNLRGQNSAPVAARLIELRVPFVLSSAYARETLDQYLEFRGITNVGKPAPTRLGSVLGALFRV